MIILIALVLLLLLVFYKFFYKESFNDNIDIIIVVSRYNEKLDWLKEEPYNKYSVIIYNKGPNNDFYKPEKLIKVVDIKNVGREGHTYLYHIIQNYEKLNNITIFLPGSNNTDYKIKKSNEMIKKIEETNKAVFLSNKVNDLYDFQLDKYQSSHIENIKLNPENNLELSTIRPFGKWKENTFVDIQIDNVSYGGIFSISNKDILQHPKTYYENLITQLTNSSNPEVGHYFERGWQAVFYPMKDTLIIE